MAKRQGGGKLLPLPFTTFGEIAVLGFKACIYCSRCYAHRPIDPIAEHLRDRCFATTDSVAPRSGTLEPSGAAEGRSRSSHPCCCQSAAQTHWPSCPAAHACRRGRSSMCRSTSRRGRWRTVKATTASSAQGAGRLWPGVSTGRRGGRPIATSPRPPRTQHTRCFCWHRPLAIS